MANEVIWVGITDTSDGQRFVRSVELTSDIRGQYTNMAERKIALYYIAGLIMRGQPIDCEIVHENNNAPVTVMFAPGTVRLDVGRSR